MFGDIGGNSVDDSRRACAFAENAAAFVERSVGKEGHTVVVARPKVWRSEAVRTVGGCGFLIVDIVWSLRFVPCAFVGIRQYSEASVNAAEVVAVNNSTARLAYLASLFSRRRGYAVDVSRMKIKTLLALLVAQFRYAAAYHRHGNNPRLGRIARTPFP